METSNLQLGFLDTISQALALKTDHFAADYPAVCQVLKEADQDTYYRLSPYLFVTRDAQEPLVAEALEANEECYFLFRQLVEEEF